MTLILDAEFNPVTGKYEITKVLNRSERTADDIRREMQDQANRSWMQMGVPDQQEINARVWGGLGNIFNFFS